MKIKSIFLIVILFLLSGCEYREKEYSVEATILSVNGRILSATIGTPVLLDGLGDVIQGDVVKIGVQFTLGERVCLEDLDLTVSEVAYYKDRSALPLKIKVIYSVPGSVGGSYNIVLGSRVLHERKEIDLDFADMLTRK